MINDRLVIIAWTNDNQLDKYRLATGFIGLASVWQLMTSAKDEEEAVVVVVVVVVEE